MANRNRDRGLAAERYFAVRLQRAAGRVVDPVLENIITSTGRVGQLTDLGFDILVGNPNDGTSLVAESKRRKVTFGAEALRALTQLFRISVEWKREPAFCVMLAENSEQWVQTKLGKRRMPKRWVLFELSYAEKLLRTLRLVNRLRAEHPEFARLWDTADLADTLEQVGDDMVEQDSE